MNKKKRKKIKDNADFLTDVLKNGKDKVEAVEFTYNVVKRLLDEEEDSFDNLPEGFQEAKVGTSIQDAIDALSDLVDFLDDLINEPDEIDEKDINDIIKELRAI